MKGIILPLMFALFIIQFVIVISGVHKSCVSTGEQECKICIKNDKQYPCDCEDKKECKPNYILIGIFPVLMIILFFISILIKKNRQKDENNK